MSIIFGILALLATLVGGFFAIKHRDRLHIILGFSAGALIGVSFFDLLPESLNVSKLGNSTTIAIVALGFTIYMVLDRTIFAHSHKHEEAEGQDKHCHKANHRGTLGAGSLSFHSFLDGVAIGFAFQASSTVGLVVALAVLTHDFADGMNTVSFILRHGGDPKQARRWLMADAIAPLVGVLVTFLYKVPESFLGPILAIFAGSFLYIGASDLLPESHHDHPRFLTTVMTLLGILTLFIIVSLAKI